MAATHSAGPDVIFGNLPTSGGSNPEAGPSITYQGDCIPDVRQPYNPGVTGKGRVFCFVDSPYIVFVDAAPSAAAPAGIAPAQAATSGIPMALAAPSPGIGPNMPLVPFGQSMSGVNVLKVLALDPGFTTASTTAGSPVVIVANIALYSRVLPGLAVVIAAGAANTWQVVTVLSVSGNNVTLSAPMGATVAAAPVTLANGTGRNDETPIAVTAYQTAGAAAVYDARSGVSRGVSVTSANAADAGWTVTVRGYDMFMGAMTEIVTVAAGAVAYGRKPFKYIASVTPLKAGGGATAGTLSIGTSDLFGFAMRSDAWEYINAFWAGNFLTASTGWTAADLTTPATGVTGAVRGTLQVSAAGPSGSFAAGGAANGVRRLAIQMTVPSDNLLYATIANPAPLFGPAQFSG